VGHFSPRPAQLGSASAQSGRRSRPVPSVSVGRCQVSPGASRTLPISLSTSRVETATHPTRYHSRYPPKPIPLLFSPTWQRRPNCRRRADHPSPPLHLSVATYVPTPWSCHTVPSCRVASHRCCCCLLCHRRCTRRGCYARSSTMRPSSSPLRWPGCSCRKHAVQATV
jgi:hypothetical protein